MEFVINQFRPGLIINSAAYTSVDKAEKEPDLVFKTNVVATKFLAEKSEKLGIPLIQLSTDYVFDGLKKDAYTEIDKANPQSVYGKSKYEAETAIQESNPKHIILRTSWVYSVRGKNFLTTILGMAQNKESFDIVFDQIGSPTSAIFIANTILEITKKIEQIENNNLYGIYNLTCLGSTSWFEFAKTIILYAQEEGLNLKSTPESIKPIKSSDLTNLASRPKNSTLNNQKLTKTFEINCPEWQNELKLIMTDKTLEM
jgi:dTDP-4-dehydrorhamnose reductase